jgi:hypothetical protein
MMANPGNTGHGGYKMQKIVEVNAKETYVEVVLACGHVDIWYPYGDRTPEEYARHIQETSIKPIVIGKTRLKCERH